VRGWLALSGAIDRFNEHLGRWISWLALIMVLIGAYNAVVRYLGRHLGANLCSNAYIELQWYLFSLLFLLGAAYTLERDAHVRVDVFYSRLHGKSRAWVNLLGTLLFLIPFCGFGLWVTWPSVRNSWAVHEVSPDPGGLPRYPIKTVILAAFVLLLLQGVSLAIRQIAVLRGASGEDETPHRAEGV